MWQIVQEFLPIIFIICGISGVVSLYIFLAYAYCTYTQDIKDSIHGIKNAILALDLNPEERVIIDGSTIRLKHLQERTASGLTEFQGFHGDHYFVLGKPLLTSISANFITYLIILVQFKVSELSVK